MSKRAVIALTICIATVTPESILSQAMVVPHEQEFVITAYYSPLPEQCCYVRGSEVADKILNGNGTNGADGTRVYPGMIAAPASYAFGTRVQLPGLGVLTVHDRGGAIIEQQNTHRLDIWAGYGEEGLARALAFGVQRIKGTVYPPGSTQPQERFELDSMPAPEERLLPYMIAGLSMMDIRPAYGQKGMSVRILQEHLAKTGYFTHAVTGFFGETTKKSLEEFVSDMELQEPGDKVTEMTATYLIAASSVSTEKYPVPFIDKNSSVQDIAKAQRMLRSLKYYRGRTDGKYSDALYGAIITYQKDRRIIANETSPGAGRIGPVTSATIRKDWLRRRTVLRAEKLIAYERIRDTLVDRGLVSDRYFQTGDTGEAVRAIQQMLAERGFFPEDRVNGVFGPQTKQSVLSYQIARGIVSGANDTGAGMVGPITMRTLREEKVRELYRIVRANGWDIL